mmetsp:Transcript_132693/g.331009  ORF Transcript_132693/g.331009 Transcript_132693/m.331009 type:complete len:246 (+) Transcript_132693:507-1244(+)
MPLPPHLCHRLHILQTMAPLNGRQALQQARCWRTAVRGDHCRRRSPGAPPRPRLHLHRAHSPAAVTSAGVDSFAAALPSDCMLLAAIWETSRGARKKQPTDRRLLADHRPPGRRPSFVWVWQASAAALSARSAQLGTVERQQGQRGLAKMLAPASDPANPSPPGTPPPASEPRRASPWSRRPPLAPPGRRPPCPRCQPRPRSTLTARRASPSRLPLCYPSDPLQRPAKAPQRALGLRRQQTGKSS